MTLLKRCSADEKMRRGYLQSAAPTLQRMRLPLASQGIAYAKGLDGDSEEDLTWRPNCIAF